MDMTNCTIIGHCHVYFQGHILEFSFDKHSQLSLTKQACGTTKFVATLLGSNTVVDPYKSVRSLFQCPPDLRLNTNLTRV